ncbi:MAG: serine protease [Elusimicrobiota bacterium]
MKRLILIVLALVAVFGYAATKVQAQVSPDVIYGDDDRLDLWQVKNFRLKQLADSTVALFKAGDIQMSGGKAKLTVASYAEELQLCKEEPFFDQVTGAFCSGSLVGPDLMMTAGHCVRTEDACKGVRFVFGFGIKEQGVLPREVPASDVYSCAKIVGRMEEGEGADYAIVKLDRKVTGHKPLQLNRAGVVAKDTPLFVIGHPAGLPTKVAGGAKVRDASPEGFFVANLDTYGGNSGSAVFNATTGLVEGILVRGENDYVWKGGCRVSNKCPAEGCRGEDVTKVGQVTSLVPQAAGRTVKFKGVTPALSELVSSAKAKTEDLGL